MTCLIEGDSIATRAGLAGQFPQCEVRAAVGLPSGAIARFPGGSFAWTAISAGSNDPGNPALRANLEAIRARLSSRIIWILPRHSRAAATVRAVAAAHGDGVVSFVAGRDGVHPASYRALAVSVRAA